MKNKFFLQFDNEIFVNLVRENIDTFDRFNYMIRQYDIEIKNNNKRVTINLTGNFINDNLLLKIINFYLINYKNKIYSLNISYNRITENGLTKLFEFLSWCPLLSEFICEGNLFNSDTFYKLLLQSKLPNELKNKFNYHDL